LSDWPLRYEREGICEVIACHYDDAEHLLYRLAPTRLYSDLRPGAAIIAGFCPWHAGAVTQPSEAECEASRHRFRALAAAGAITPDDRALFDTYHN
jgi:hypothetical protein